MRPSVAPISTAGLEQFYRVSRRIIQENFPIRLAWTRCRCGSADAPCGVGRLPLEGRVH
jgi:hypothetical protein